ALSAPVPQPTIGPCKALRAGSKSRRSQLPSKGKCLHHAKAQFRLSAEPWADTGISIGWLMLAVLGGLSDAERDPIRTPIAEGRSRAKPKGDHGAATFP